MFFFQQSNQKEVRVTAKTVRIRGDWGVLQEIIIFQGTPILTDQELADQLEVGLITVITHRRD